MEPLFLEGVFQDKIWGGAQLREEFGYEIPTDTTGELWAISAHPNGPARVKNGDYAGKTLADLWETHRELFGNQEGDVFPLLTKIIDARKNLSVQVHPDDAYGLAHEGELGKTECWYILSADPGTEIIYGHNAQSKEEFQQLIENGQWDNLLRSVKVKAGDFFYVPSGTVHGIGSGVMILETQQSSDTTYRLYDYNRKDDDGDPRELHIEQSIEVSTIPHIDQQPQPIVEENNDSILKILVSNDFFTVYDWFINGNENFKQQGLYTLVSVIEGDGEIKGNNKTYPITKGDHFLIPNQMTNWEIEGNIHLIASNP